MPLGYRSHRYRPYPAACRRAARRHTASSNAALRLANSVWPQSTACHATPLLWLSQTLSSYPEMYRFCPAWALRY